MHVYFLSEETTASRARSWRVKGGVELKRKTVTIQVSFYHKTQKQPERKTDRHRKCFRVSQSMYVLVYMKVLRACTGKIKAVIRKKKIIV